METDMRNLPTLKFFKTLDVPDPKFSTKGSACFDLHLPENICLHSMQILKVNLGIIFDIPEEYCLKMYVRSSIASQGVLLANSVGIIDSDYVGEVSALLVHIDWPKLEIKKGSRIVQLELVKVVSFDTEELSEAPKQKGNRFGGFGSTGV